MSKSARISIFIGSGVLTLFTVMTPKLMETAPVPELSVAQIRVQQLSSAIPTHSRTQRLDFLRPHDDIFSPDASQMSEVKDVVAKLHLLKFGMTEEQVVETLDLALGSRRLTVDPTIKMMSLGPEFYFPLANKHRLKIGLTLGRELLYVGGADIECRGAGGFFVLPSTKFGTAKTRFSSEMSSQLPSQTFRL